MDTVIVLSDDQLDREMRQSVKDLLGAARGMVVLSVFVMVGVMLWLTAGVYEVSAVGAVFALASLLMLMHCAVDAVRSVLWLLAGD